MRFGFWPSASNPWSEVLTIARHAERTGWDRIWFADHFMIHRDPAEIQRSACTLLVMTDNDTVLGRVRASGRPVLGGSNEEIKQTVQAYIDAGVDEIIIPDNTLGSSASQRMEQMDRFIEEIAPAFRQE